MVGSRPKRWSGSIDCSQVFVLGVDAVCVCVRIQEAVASDSAPKCFEEANCRDSFGDLGALLLGWQAGGRFGAAFWPPTHAPFVLSPTHQLTKVAS